VASYLSHWLKAQRHRLKPKTLFQYDQYVAKDLVPALGNVKLEALRHEHIAAMVVDLEGTGRGATTIKRIIATLSSALNHAVKTKRLTQRSRACRHACGYTLRDYAVVVGTGSAVP